MKVGQTLGYQWCFIFFSLGRSAFVRRGNSSNPTRNYGAVAPPNGLELSCPAEAGRLSRIVRPAGGPGKQPRKRRPPGQLQRVVRRHQVMPGFDNTARAGQPSSFCLQYLHA